MENGNNDPNRPRWRHDLAEKASWWLEKHPEWVCTALSSEQEAAWRRAEEGGKKKRLVWKNGKGLEVRSYGEGAQDNGNEGPNEAQPEDPLRSLHGFG